ncbi:MAG: cell envelope biogenesis protein OmpA [Flavobacteriales bacterium]|nr:MAG: cell envelope biogenesis protein OmpA [Flavobacteriales bacterium]
MFFRLSLHSQNEENPWLFEFGINSVNAEDSDKTSYRLPTLSLSRYIFKNFSVGINYSENDINVSNEDLYYYSLDGIVKYNFPSESKFLGVDTNPYLYAGYGLSNFGESDISLASKNTSYGPSFGAGIDFQISKNIALNTGISYKSLNEKNAYSNLQHVVGIKFNFGKGDSDGDGVPDKKDQCPDLPGLSELNGCPDSDGDGISDLTDQCPNSPGLNSMGGCPDSDGDGISDLTDPCPNSAGINGEPCPDSDGDGLNDNLDNCPNEAGPKSNGGCKLDDIDNDGVPNINDNCPNEAGDKEFGGCPKLPTSLSNFLNNYSEFFFDFDSYELNQNQISNIYDLSKILDQYDYIKVNIDGHASSEEKPDYNLQLSQNRSNTIKNTLIENGIQDSRLNTRAFGEHNPGYPEIPLSERKKNRRVILSINMDL